MILRALLTAALLIATTHSWAEDRNKADYSVIVQTTNQWITTHSIADNIDKKYLVGTVASIVFEKFSKIEDGPFHIGDTFLMIPPCGAEGQSPCAGFEGKKIQVWAALGDTQAIRGENNLMLIQAENLLDGEVIAAPEKQALSQ